MKLFLVFIAIAIGFLQFKSTRNPPLIKQVTNLQRNTSVTYTYTPDGKISAIVNSRGDSVIYKYAGSMILKSTSKGLAPDTFALNDKGLAILVNNINQQNQIFYDADGFRVKMIVTGRGEGGGIKYWSVKGGNINSTWLIEEGKKQDSTVYTYYTAKLNTIGNENMGQGFRGKSSKNPEHELLSFDETGLIIGRIIYSYHYDAAGRITIRAAYTSNGTLTDSTGYDYY
jgi:hypothetical protein